MPAEPGPRKVTQRWFSRLLRPLIVCAVLVPGIPALVTLAPMPYHVAVGFIIQGPATETPTYLAPGPGYLTFHWSANSSAPGNLSLFGWPSSAAPLLQAPDTADLVWGEGGTAGSGRVALNAGYDYVFEFSGGPNQTASVTGSIWGTTTIYDWLQPPAGRPGIPPPAIGLAQER
jgi:hypothetical protein